MWAELKEALWNIQTRALPPWNETTAARIHLKVTKKDILSLFFIFSLASVPMAPSVTLQGAKSGCWPNNTNHPKKSTAFCWISSLPVSWAGLAHRGFVWVLTKKRWDCVVGWVNLWSTSVHLQRYKERLVLEDFSLSSYIDWSWYKLIPLPTNLCTLSLDHHNCNITAQ